MADGVRELNIVAQDTTYYGIDLYGEPRLAELLAELNKLDGLDWIRVMYLYPMYFSDELIDVLATSEKILPYLDLPLQHINDTMLRRMQRRVDRASTEELIGKLRSRIRQPCAADDIHHRLSRRDRRAVRGAGGVRRGSSRFERMGVFTYSFEADTPSSRIPDHLPEDIKESRRERLMAVQQEVAFAWNAAQVGKRMDVLIDAAVPGEKNAWVGRGFADAPDVDGVVFVTGKKLAPGEIVPVEIVATSDYDLVGVAVGKSRLSDRLG